MKTLMAAFVLGLGSLARVAPAQEPQPQRLPPTVTTDANANSVTVQNQRQVPVTVYMEYGTFDRRLGVVPPFQTAVLALPKWAVQGRSQVQLFAHPEGSASDLSSQLFALRAPARIGMVIPPHGGMPPSPPDTMMAMIPDEAIADATLTVDNPRDVAVTVYAQQGQWDARLGQVSPRSRATLRFPKSVVGPARSLTVLVHPEGGLDLASETLRVKRGEHLGLRVPPR